MGQGESGSLQGTPAPAGPVPAAHTLTEPRSSRAVLCEEPGAQAGKGLCETAQCASAARPGSDSGLTIKPECVRSQGWHPLNGAD